MPTLLSTLIPSGGGGGSSLPYAIISMDGSSTVGNGDIFPLTHVHGDDVTVTADVTGERMTFAAAATLIFYAEFSSALGSSTFSLRKNAIAVNTFAVPSTTTASFFLTAKVTVAANDYLTLVNNTGGTIRVYPGTITFTEVT